MMGILSVPFVTFLRALSIRFYEASVCGPAADCRTGERVNVRSRKRED
jgi:hypothetical protein